MKRLVHSSRERPEQAPSSRTIRKPRIGAVGGAILSSLLLAAPAQTIAEEPSLSQPAASVESWYYKLEGREVTLRNKKGKIIKKGCVVHQTFEIDATLSLQGPMYYRVDFYPFVDRYLLEGSKQLNQEVTYTLGDNVGSAITLIRPSNLKVHGFKLPPELRVGTPIRIEGEVGPGVHVLTIKDPSGILVIVESKELLKLAPLVSTTPEKEPPLVPITPEKEPSEATPTKPPVPAEKPKVTEKPPSEKPPVEKPKEEAKVAAHSEKSSPVASAAEPLVETTISEEAEASPLLLLKFERTALAGLGKHSNSGNINNVEVLVMPQLNDNWALLLGVSGGVHSLSTDAAETETNLDLLFGRLVAGASFNKGAHTVFAALHGGAGYITPKVLSKLNSLNKEYAVWSTDFGGQVGYSYDGSYGIVISGGNNPFNPLSGVAYASIPSWVDGEHLKLDADVKWLHLIRPNTDSSLSGDLDYNDILVRANLRMPIVRLWRIVPSAAAAFELNIDADSEAATRPDGLFGGTLALELGLFRLEGGYLHSIRGNHVVLINAKLSH